MSHAQNKTRKTLNAFVSGCSFQDNCGIIDIKGGGSAYGGKWRPNPNKPNDMAFVGEPNSRQRHFIPTKKGGYWVEGKYNENGKAEMIRHETGHAEGSGHSNPHDHKIEWVGPDNHPEWGEIINYPDGNVPDFKNYYMNGATAMVNYNPETLRFKTISEFKWSMNCGAEVVIEWKDKEFGIWSNRNTIRITSDSSTEQNFYSADDALEYQVCGDRLRDVITQVTVIDRTV
ncbi:MAG: hypothetical protein E7456_06915 [Ruminococcaceae bacterium]|nr:hypothetical protein [Oscillospiraceae bacterium]